MKEFYLEKSFITPPKNAGQIIEVSYSVGYFPNDKDEKVIIKRIYDRNKQREDFTAYHFPASGEFNPWNGEPKLGPRIGRCEIYF